jgi:hypothetical protein
MAGTWNFIDQFRVDGEQYMSGSDSGTYNNCQKISDLISTTGGALSVAPVTVANMQAFFLQSDQICNIVFTLSTGSLTITLPANGAYSWSVNSGQANPFAHDIVSAVVNFTGPVTSVTITCRIATT